VISESRRHQCRIGAAVILRATLAIIAVGLVRLGGALAGFASAHSFRNMAGKILFEIGGVVPIVFALAAIFTLPESIKFMTLHESQRGKMEALLTAIARASRHRRTRIS